MSDQINLCKKGPSRAIPRIEWHGWTVGKDFGWLEQKVRSAPQVELGDITNGGKTYPTEEEAVAAKLRAAARKLKAGFEYRDEAPPSPEKPPKPSKPWPKGKATPPPWLAKADKKQLAKLRKAIDAAKLSHRRADIESLLRPAIRLTLKRVKPAAIKGVVTRFGGDPDLPAKFAWPTNGGTPLAFMAQYRLDELAKLDLEGKLPRRGLLSVFAHLADGDDYGVHARVFHFPDPKALVRTTPPHGADADDRPSKVALATPSVQLTLPPPDHSAARALRLGDDRERYHDEVWLVTRAWRDDSSGPGAHQLLGWPDAKGWELVAQIDSDDRFGFELGDVEMLRIHIATSKLAGADFRTVRCAMTAD